MTAPSPAIFQILLSFFRLGLTAFGGPSMIVYIRRMAVERKHWISPEDLSAGVALCQVIPGAIAMQVAAYVGLRIRGASGAISAFAGFGLPSFFFMILLSVLYLRFQDLPVAISLFSGLQAIIVGIVAHASLSFGGSALKNWRDMIITATAALLFSFHVSPILVIILAALAGRVMTSTGHKGPGEPERAGPVNLSTKGHFGFFAIVTVVLLVLLFFLQRHLFDLAILMSKIDLFAFGGGFASIPLMLHELVDVRGWIDVRTFMNGILLGQVTPGPIVITATFVGYLLYGLPGGLMATFGIFMPSFLILVGVTPHFERLRSFPGVNRALHGILCAFVGLLVRVVGYFASGIQWDTLNLGLCAATFLALFLKVDILWVFLGGVVPALLR